MVKGTEGGRTHIMTKQNKRPASGSRRGRVPGHSSFTPFCAYYEHGETCQVATGLQEVLVIAGPPRLIIVACPAHHQAVRTRAEEFVLRCQLTPQMIAF